MSAPFEARYGGRCASCGEGFSTGDLIRYTDADELVHAGGCPDPALTELDVRPGEKVCPACHIIHPPGECW